MSPGSITMGGLVFAVAGVGDANDLARLQARPMQGKWLSLSIASRPDYGRAARLHGEHGALVVRRVTGEVVGMCARSVRPAYIDGEVRPLGYLGELRVADPSNRRPRLVRDGFAAVRQLLHEPHRTPYYLTAIADGNEPAERLLTAGLGGMPTYRPAGELKTLAIPTRSPPSRLFRRVGPPAGVAIEGAVVSDLDAIATCLERNHRRYQLAPVWTARDLADQDLVPNLRAEDFVVARRCGEVVGCLALWDQRPVKQIVIAGYRGGVARWRPLLNFAAPLAGWPGMPPAGSVLSQAFLSHVAVDGDDADVFSAMVEQARLAAARRGIGLVLVGLSGSSPMLGAIGRTFTHRAYGSRLYLVHWEDGRASVEALSQRVAHPEIAVM